MEFSRTVLTWFKSYIVGRAQRVVSRACNQSDWLDTNLGVPQGSVLGPLLFSLYINDLSDILNSTYSTKSTKTINHILYADDLQIYIQTTRDELVENITRLGVAAHAVSVWAEDSGHRLKVGKTKAIIFGCDFITLGTVKTYNFLALGWRT